MSSLKAFRWKRKLNLGSAQNIRLLCKRWVSLPLRKEEKSNRQAELLSVGLFLFLANTGEPTGKGSLLDLMLTNKKKWLECESQRQSWLKWPWEGVQNPKRRDYGRTTIPCFWENKVEEREFTRITYSKLNKDSYWQVGNQAKVACRLQGWTRSS